MMIDIIKTRLGKLTNRYTDKTIVKNSVSICTTRSNTQYSATLVTTLKNDNETLEQLRITLTESTLREALRKIENHKR